MGVTGLWKLIEPCGTPVPVETLEGKILAVDISIWLHQVVKGFQDSSGSALAYAHLLGLFHRLCKLLYYRVKPVFVFDGSVPQLKRDTIARRQQQRSKLNNEANRIQNLLLEQLAKEQVVQKALGSAANELLPAKRNNTKTNAQTDADEMFKLPELPNLSQNSLQDESSLQETSFDSDEQSSSEDNCASRHYQNNLQAIDVRSQHFRSLPADMRYDILLDIKETRKQSSWGRLHELPAQSDQFSSFQMQRLLKRRAVQESLEEAEQEMGGRTLTYTELQTYFKEEGVLSAAAIEEASRQIASDENTRFLLVRDLKNIVKQPKPEDIKNESIVPEKKAKAELEPLETETLGQDYEADLQLALALSLSEQTADNIYKSEDNVLPENTKLKLNAAQRAQLRDSAKGPAKSYMIEYAGMNAEEVVDILEKTQLAGEMTKNVSNVNPSVSGNDVQMLEEKSKEENSNVNFSIGENDVQMLQEKSNENVTETKAVQETNAIEVVIDLNKEWNEDDDIFADIFDDLEKKKESKEMNDASISSDSDDDFIVVPEHNSQAKILYLNSDSDEELLVLPEKTQEKMLSEADKIEKSKKTLDVAANKTACEVIEIENSAKNFADGIFEELRLQLEQAKHIDLDKVEIKNDIIEIKEETAEQLTEIKKNDVIEINDTTDDEANIMPKTSITTTDKTSKPTTPFTTPRKASKPNTPSRITDFYERDYIIKRTPEKIEQTPVNKVKSPFFRSKTPKSKSPKNAETVHQSKAAKKLFDSKNEASAEEVLQEAAAALKQQKSDVELRSLATGLAHERRELESERNRQDRMGMNITQRMNLECQELLRLFGIPYIVAPMEAEAQCAFLEAVQLTHGTITDDSDIWLFGGRTVYKNFFAQNKHVLKFSAEEIETQFKCDRQTLVQLACLVGSDYTTGINGIGAVTALEILATFTATRSQQTDASNMHHTIKLIMDTLQRFRDWWQASMVSAVVPGSSTRHKLLKKLRNIEMHEGFPNLAVIKAYLQPNIDESRTAFSWGQPDVESIREFARKTFGWTNTKTDDIMRPVLKRLAEKSKQTSMRNYFLTRNAISVRQLKVSKRVQVAIDRLGNDGASDETIVAKKTNARRKRQVKTNSVANDATADQAQTSKNLKPKRSNAKKAAVPHTSKEVIPQREKDLVEMLKNREKAVKLLSPLKKKNKN